MRDGGGELGARVGVGQDEVEGGLHDAVGGGGLLGSVLWFWVLVGGWRCVVGGRGRLP